MAVRRKGAAFRTPKEERTSLKWKGGMDDKDGGALCEAAVVGEFDNVRAVTSYVAAPTLAASNAVGHCSNGSCSPGTSL